MNSTKNTSTNRYLLLFTFLLVPCTHTAHYNKWEAKGKIVQAIEQAHQGVKVRAEGLDMVEKGVEVEQKISSSFSKNFQKSKKAYRSS